MKANKNIIFSAYIAILCFSIVDLICPFKILDIYRDGQNPAFEMFLGINEIAILIISISGFVILPINIWCYYKNNQKLQLSFKAFFYSATLYSIFQLLFLRNYYQTTDGFEYIFLAF